jgi:hypothetical protein
MTDNIWEPNPNWLEIDSPAEGDIVQLKHTSAFSHLVMVIVSSVDEDSVTGIVEAVFDWETKGHITGGEIFSLVGKELTFKKRMIQNVIKKPAHLK